jgi:hypothetical protein
MLAVEFARFLGLEFTTRANITDVVNAVCASAAQPGHALFPRHRRPHLRPRQGDTMTSPATLAAGICAHTQGLHCPEPPPSLLIGQSWLHRGDFTSRFIVC